MKRARYIILAAMIFTMLMQVTVLAEENDELKSNEAVTERLLDDEIDNSTSEAIDDEIAYFDNMTIDELNQYIDEQAENSLGDSENTQSKYVSREAVPQGNLKNAWLAAAAIARKKGYPCAATLVEHSVKNQPYSEANANGTGLFSKKIKKTTVHKNAYEKMKNSKKTKLSGSLTFKKSANADLFYALHKANYSFSGDNVGTALASYRVTYSDTFDFQGDNNYDSLFTSCVNNWAWLCQQTKVLNKIKVTINFIP